MSKISLFKCTFDTRPVECLSIEAFLEFIKVGRWQDSVLPVRAIPNKKERDEAKKKVPCVTIGGVIDGERKDGNITIGSGFIGIDIDDVNPEETKSMLNCDEHVYATFTSIGGRGLCVVFRINPSKYRQAHAGIEQYLYDTYDIIIDPTSVNPSRLRFVSFDPHLYINKDATKFTKYIEVKPVPQGRTVIFAKTDFDKIILEIQQRRVNLCESYQDWLRIGFALADQFGAEGAQYFHIISQQSSKYNPQQCDKQWQNCLKGSRGTGKRVHIATFYYCCKLHGIEIYSQRTTAIMEAADVAKRKGKTKVQVLQQVGEDPDGIIEQVFNSNDVVPVDDTLFGELQRWLKANYNLRKNLITRQIEMDGKPIEQDDLNTMYIDATKEVSTKVKYDYIDRLIRSTKIERYNPFDEFFRANNDRQPAIGTIDSLFDCIQTDDDTRIFMRLMFKKWMVSIIASIHGTHSPLMLVLTGNEQNTGKTEFFRRLLPPQLQCFYAESKLDAGKDDEILMTKKLLIMDDEMSGKSKKEENTIKSILSKQVFSLREPYGRVNVDLNRLAVLCATTNTTHILSDPTGNRRFLPVQVYSIDHQKYNSIDKIDLIMEAYHLYVSGFQWRLTRDEIAMLAVAGVTFEKYSLEYELIAKHYAVPTGDQYLEMTAGEIQTELWRKTGQKLSPEKIGKELRRMGFVQLKQVRVGKIVRRPYAIQEASGIGGVSVVLGDIF